MAFKRRLKFDKRIRFQKRMNIVYILLFVVLVSIGTGYAYIRSDLNVNGTANVTAASWDVHFDNLQVTTGSVTATTPASITDDTTVEFSAELEEPNDFYEFLVDVVNDGTMDAMIDSFSISPTLTTAQAKYLEYTVSYSDGTELVNKQELKADTSETFKVRFKYKKDDDKTNYPTTDQNFTIAFTVNYSQADNTAQTVRTYLYSIKQAPAYVGDNISTLGTTYTSYQTLINNTGKNIFLRSIVANNQIVKTDLGFIYNNNVYYLIGGGATYNSTTGEYNGDSKYYEQNKTTLQSVFGGSNCSEESVGGYIRYLCNVSDVSYQATAQGHVGGGAGWGCDAHSNAGALVYSQCVEN